MSIPEEFIPLARTGPGLYYAHSDGKTITRIDLSLIHDPYVESDDSDRTHREQLLCRALITHALSLIDGEDNA